MQLLDISSVYGYMAMHHVIEVFISLQIASYVFYITDNYMHCLL